MINERLTQVRHSKQQNQVVSTWIDDGFIAFDTETTGLDPAESRIVTAAAIEFRGGEPMATRDWLIKVDVEIPERAAAVHGITTQISQERGQDQALALAEIRDHLMSSGLPVVCFNTSFDIPMLDANLRRQGLEELRAAAVICPYVIDRELDKYVKGKNQRRLKPTAERYGLELSDEDWHGAEADSLVAGRILVEQGKRFALVRDTPPADLATLIDQWRAQQEADYQAWKARQSQ